MKIKKSIALSEAGFVFNPITGESFTINPIGTEIIQMLNEGKSGTEVADHICQRYQVDRHTFEKDLSDFFGMLDHYHISEHHEQEEA